MATAYDISLSYRESQTWQNWSQTPLALCAYYAVSANMGGPSAIQSEQDILVRDIIAKILVEYKDAESITQFNANYYGAQYSTDADGVQKLVYGVDGVGMVNIAVPLMEKMWELFKNTYVRYQTNRTTQTLVASTNPLTLTATLKANQKTSSDPTLQDMLAWMDKEDGQCAATYAKSGSGGYYLTFEMTLTGVAPGADTIVFKGGVVAAGSTPLFIQVWSYTHQRYFDVAEIPSVVSPTFVKTEYLFDEIVPSFRDSAGTMKVRFYSPSAAQNDYIAIDYFKIVDLWTDGVQGEVAPVGSTPAAPPAFVPLTNFNQSIMTTSGNDLWGESGQTEPLSPGPSWDTPLSEYPSNYDGFIPALDLAGYTQTRPGVWTRNNSAYAATYNNAPVQAPVGYTVPTPPPRVIPPAWYPGALRISSTQEAVVYDHFHMHDYGSEGTHTTGGSDYWFSISSWVESTGPIKAVGLSSGSTGNGVWSNIAGAVVLKSGDATISPAGGYSKELVLSLADLDLTSLPDDATIVGIQMTVVRRKRN